KPMRGRGGRLLSILVVALAVAGCGGDNPTSASLWCDGVCAAVHRCGYADPGCASNCVSQRPGLAQLSVSGAAAQKPCLAQLSCEAIGGDDAAWKSEVDGCW